MIVNGEVKNAVKDNVELWIALSASILNEVVLWCLKAGELKAKAKK